MAHPSTTPEDSPMTWTGGLSAEELSQAEQRAAERMKPSRQRNMTPSQRAQVARALRALRADYFAATRGSSGAQ